MRKKQFYTLLIAALMSLAGCENTFYDVYNDFTGPVESVAIPKVLSVVINTTEKLNATVYPLLTENKDVSWLSVNGTGQIAVDQNGNVSGVAVGTATVTVTTEEGGKTASCTVTVVPAPIPVTSLILPETLSVEAGLQSTLTYSYLPANATNTTNTDMIWTSSNSGIAAIDPTGLTDGVIVTGVSSGTATITVTSTKWGASASCTVTVGDPTYTVTYSVNAPSGATVTGSMPVDSTPYKIGDQATLKDSTGFGYTGYRFRCWSTTPNGDPGTLRYPGDKYTVAGNVVFYAQWGYGVTYNGNGHTRGLLPVDNTPYLTGNTVTVKTSFTASNGNLVKIENTTISTSKAYRCSGWTDGTNTYAEGATFTINSSVTLTAIWTEYQIGDIGPAGGRIFYIAPSYQTSDYGNWRYMEAGPEDLSTGIKWTTNAYLNTAIPNGVLGKTETSVGSGKKNTVRIVSQVNNLNQNSEYASGLINSYSKNGCGDWFLPSKDELGFMFTNLRLSGLGGFTDGNYWTSSEDTATNAWYQFFDINHGGQVSISKSTTNRVRPVHAF